MYVLLRDIGIGTPIPLEKGDKTVSVPYRHRNTDTVIIWYGIPVFVISPGKKRGCIYTKPEPTWYGLTANHNGKRKRSCDLSVSLIKTLINGIFSSCGLPGTRHQITYSRQYIAHSPPPTKAHNMTQISASPPGPGTGVYLGSARTLDDIALDVDE